MQSGLKELRASGAEVLAICTDPPEESANLAEKLGLEYPILSDAELAVTDAYGVRHVGGNPMEGADVARPALFVIDREGRIQARELTENWRIRVRPERVVELVAALP